MNVTITKCFKAYALCCLFVIPLSALSAPLDPADTTTQELLRQQERLRLLREQQEIKPDAREAGEQLKQAAPIVSDVIPEHETPCFTMSKITLVGDSADKFQFALDQVLGHSMQGNPLKEQPILGRCLGVVGINAVMTRVQNAIIAKGYTTTRVLAAPQDLKTGTLQLTVIPGRIHTMRFASDSSQHVSAWNALPMQQGDILNLRDIEQALENFKRVPTAEADIQIAPATEASSETNGTQTNPLLGYSDVVIRYQQRFPLRVSINVDDAGASSTGKYQGGVTLSGDNLLMLNDLLYVNYNHDLGGGDAGKRGNDGYTVHYSMPWDYWLLGVTTSSNDFYQQVAGVSQTYIFSGKSDNTELQLSRLVYRNSINKSIVSLKGFLHKSSNYIDDTEIEVQRRRTAGWELGFNQSWFIGNAILDYNLAYRRGTGAEDALKAPEEARDEGTSRMKLWLADLNLSVPFQVTAPWGPQAMQYSARIRAQNNRTPLTPQDRFSIGNRYTVRGFDGQQTLLADNGWFVRNELMAPLGASGQSVYWGLDYGQVGGQSSDYLLGKHLAGTVLGLRGGGVNDLGHLSYDVFVGKPLNKPKGFATHDAVAGFSFNYAY